MSFSLKFAKYAANLCALLQAAGHDVHVVLVNTNRIRPPIAPIGLEYVAEALSAAGYRVSILDLCWAEDWRANLRSFFRREQPRVVGLTLRNTDDCAFATRQSFLPEFAEIVGEIKSCTDAVLVVGGVGFSTMPEYVLQQTGVEYGIWGDGEFSLPALLEYLQGKRKGHQVPGLVHREKGGYRRTPQRWHDLILLPRMGRGWFENARYFREGAQIGFETKRGCDRSCVYCADPVAKGRKVRLRPPNQIVDELRALVDQGIDHFHTCDSEFNLDPEHARSVCQAIIQAGLSETIRWYAYCCPRPFSRELAFLMRRAGCAGINFGVDSGDEGMLKRLGRDHSPQDLVEIARWCREAGIAVMFDLLIGAPGESPQSIHRTIELMKRASPDRVGVSIGVRVYPGTPLSRAVKRQPLRSGLVGGGPHDPEFFLEPQIGGTVFQLVDRLVSGDQRFFFFDPSRPERDYNYNANQRLLDAIQRGYRGAYWDILRRYSQAGAA